MHFFQLIYNKLLWFGLKDMKCQTSIVYLEDDFKTCKHKTKRRKKRKKKIIIENSVDDLVIAEYDIEQLEAQKVYENELIEHGYDEIIPVSFGKPQLNKKKTEKKINSKINDLPQTNIKKNDNSLILPTTNSRKRKLNNDSNDLENIVFDSVIDNNNNNDNKYWFQRYRLFSKFDEGIKMDKEGWYSVTPEIIAKHIAEICKCDIIIDPFAGCGGNVIQMAKTCCQVIAIDIEPKKIKLAKDNAKIYGVDHKIEWLIGDSIQLLPFLHLADVIFLSPPWGGPEYISCKSFDLSEMIIKQNVNGMDLFHAAMKITNNVAYFLPKNIMKNQLFDIAKIYNTHAHFEKNFINNKWKTVTVYYGDLAIETNNNNNSSVLTSFDNQKEKSREDNKEIEIKSSGSKEVF